jgi:iron(III) transport system permease protein
MTLAAEPINRPTPRHTPLDVDGWTQRISILLLLAVIGLLIVAPLAVMVVRSLTDDAGGFVGIRNFIACFGDAEILQSLGNTLILGIATMTATVLLAFPFAYAVSCTQIPLRKTLLIASMLPIYAPTMLYGLGLYSLFGNQGLLTTGLFGRVPLHVNLYIHGMVGIILAEVLACFPPVVLILCVSLSHRDRRLYEAAASMGVSGFRVLRSITLPLCKAGLISAAAVAFMLSTTDYGAPEMLAEKTNVLALDIAIRALGIGQKSDHAIGAVISLMLLVPTVGASIVQMAMRRRQAAALSARSVPMQPDRNPPRDALLLLYCLLVIACILTVTAAPVVISLARSWPYSLYPASQLSHISGPAFTLANFNFDRIGQATGGGMNAYWTSLQVAALTAIAGTAFSFLAAYLVEKTRVLSQLRHLARSIAVIPLGLPGMVLGLAFVLIFNPLKWGPVPNPVAGLYGTLALLVICNSIHYLGVSFLTASTAVAQLDGEFEQVAASMAVPTWRLFLRVTLPICLPAILEIAIYYFVSAMTTVSAVMFLVSVRTPLASVAIINLKDAGNLEPAAAMAVLILLSNIVLHAAVEPVLRSLRHRTQRWQAV